MGRTHRARRAVVAATGMLAAAAALAAPEGAEAIDITVLSSRADQVSGGDALVRVDAPRGLLGKLAVLRGGTDVTGAFAREDGALVGLVEGLRDGENTLAVRHNRRSSAPPAERLSVVNHPITGPMFSGPHQRPFVCKTIQAGLGEPLVDNQSGQGFRVLRADGSTAGWSLNCSATTQVDYLYRTTGGQFRPLPADGSRPADLAQTTTLDGRTVDFVVRRERGTINRFIYSYAMLAPLGSRNARDTSLWNRRLVYTFDGGVAIGRNQGTPGGSALDPRLLGLGYGIAHSSGTRTSVHYNLQLGGETALMTKEGFVERYGVPRYTVGVGGSGGAIQQYVYGQNHPSLLDAGIPVVSYPDMVTQTIHIGDCELLERFMDAAVAADPTSKWARWDNRSWLIGLNAEDAFPNPYTGRAGSTECVNGWRGLTPLAMNPLFGTAGAGTERMDPAEMARVHWTHWEDLRSIYGVRPDGYARQTWDNVGVQYGLQALRDGRIDAEEFLHLNATAGSWKDAGAMVQEGRPFVPVGAFDPWSARNMQLSPDGGVTPAPRRTGDIEAMRAAYRSGIYFDGDIDIPLIDVRPYLEPVLDMHNSHQSFASRQRMLDFDGDASNQVIWFSERVGTDTPMLPEAFDVIDEWLANLRAHPDRGVAGNRPDRAQDACFEASTALIARGPDVWSGALDGGPTGPCLARFPIHSTSRIVADGPIRGGVFKCALQSIDLAIDRGLYGSWKPNAEQRARLRQIFPTGVCDYTQPDQGRPAG